MPEAPLVRICVPVFNAADTVKVSLDSILGQTYRNIEVLVVDNASDDGTLGIADAGAKADPRLRVIRGETNIGAVPNLLRCMGLAGGKYTAIFHADDIYSPDMIAKQVAFLDGNPEAGLVFTMASAIDSDGRPWRRYTLPRDLAAGVGRTFDFREMFRSILKNGNFLFTPSPLVRTEIYRDEIHDLRAELAGTSVDLDLWLRIFEKHRVGIIDEPLLNYRVAKESFSYRHLRAKTERHDLFKVLEHYLALSADWLSPEDMINYRFLTLKDQVNRAFNLYVTGCSGEARKLLLPVFAPAVLSRAATGRNRLKVVFMGTATMLLSLLPATAGLRDRIAQMRY